MLSQALANAFGRAAVALAQGLKDTGFTSNGLRKLDFKASDEEGQSRIFTALQQNPNKLSLPAQLAREGHKIFQIRDNTDNKLLGHVDIEPDGKKIRFNSYENIPQPVTMDDIDQALEGHAKMSDIPVVAARTTTPAGGQQSQSPSTNISRDTTPISGPSGDQIPDVGNVEIIDFTDTRKAA